MNTPTSPSGKLSAPIRHGHPPRPLSDVELRTLLAIADLLIPRSGDNPSASELPDYPALLEPALGAFWEDFDDLMATIEPLAAPDVTAEQIERDIRRLSREEPDRFFVLSEILAGAYFTSPIVRTLIRVPPLQPNPPSFAAAADDLDDGILDVVIERGPTYTPTDDCPR